MTAAVEDGAMTEEAVHARRWLAEHGLPTGREEGWRYAPVDAIRARLDQLSGSAVAVDVPVSETDVDRLAGRHGAARIVLVDGVHVPEWSSDVLPGGVWCGTVRNLSPSVREHLTTPASDPADGFEALNRTASQDVVYLLVADGADVSEPVHVVHMSTGAGVAHPRVVVDVGDGARVALVESHVGLAGDGFTNASTTVHLAPGAHATVHRVQGEAPGAVHVGRLQVHQQEGSRSDVTVLTHGAGMSRMATAVDLGGPASSCRITRLLAPEPGTRHDDLVTVDHASSGCTSELTSRAVVPERARTSATGHVIVRPGTVATAAHQRADSLLLHPTAQSDSRPWLEIFADDVRADHGSATGRLDEDALFYLRSRGIPRDEARNVLVGAFARSVVEQLRPASLQAQVARWFGWEEEA